MQIESVMADGSRLIKFANGTEKVISADERTISVTFFNGDVKRILPDNRMVCSFLYFALYFFLPLHMHKFYLTTRPDLLHLSAKVLISMQSFEN